MKINQNGQSDEWCGTHITNMDNDQRPLFEALKEKYPSLPPVDEMLAEPDLICHFTKTSTEKFEPEEKEESTEKEESKEKEEFKWKEFDVCVYAGDDYFKMDKDTPIDVVKEKCIELGSWCFVTKDNCQRYIRSPPGGRKKNRDRKSIMDKAEQRKIEGKVCPQGYKSYVYGY